MYDVLATCDRARIGRLKTGHGSVETPCFLPVATQGSVKTLTFSDVEGLGFEALISNAFLLYLRPGESTIKKAGGLHGFMGWEKSIFTDSGGFQMLNPDFMIRSNDKGVVFKSPFDQSKHLLTPESCMDIQSGLGSDVAMVLDALAPYSSSKEEQELALKRNFAWAKRCKEAQSKCDQLLFAITQGGVYSDLRNKSASELISLDFDGYAIGGLSIGEPREVMLAILGEQASILPLEKPRYLMGVGSPVELLEAISLGIDIFDSTFPTRNARHNQAYTFKGDMNLSRGRFREDFAPIEDGCNCYACKNHSRAYVHHLLKSREATGKSLVTMHNLFFVQRLLETAKDKIKQRGFHEFKGDMQRRLGGTAP
jgi:queuine tRNA-ribosyltransferase